MSEIPCSYCGRLTTKPEREHVFPKCLYPASKNKSKIQRLTIPACRCCNNSWSDDEAHFRNVLMLAGEPNPARQELWETDTLRSFDEVDGFRRMSDLIERMKPIAMQDGSLRHMIFPGKDERVIRVVKKVVRGLCQYHNVVWPISDQRVWADILKYQVPTNMLNQMQYHHREQDIAEYRYQILEDNEINSAWLITFFQKVTFIGLVSTSENGFS